MKVLFVTCCLFFAGFFSPAQNLVLNPGFEEHGEISGNGAGTDNLKGNHVKNWISPTAGSPDYFLTTSDYLYNQYGSPRCHSGEAMAGIVVYGGKKDYREYISGELSSPLEAGKKYELTLSVALAAVSGVAVEHIGIYFSSTVVSDLKNSSALKFIPQISIDETDQKGIQGSWLDFHVEYIASGGEKFLTIGNFLSDKKTVFQKTASESDRSAPYAYYYLDNISLIPANEIDTTEIPVADPIATEKDTLQIAAGKKLIVNNVYFDVDKSILKEESFPVLDEIISEMKSQPDLKVEIDGHTDSDGTPEHNLQLSKERAKSVAAYFVSKGIDASRISTNGFGSSKPISSDKNKNRRVEFIFSD